MKKSFWKNIKVLENAPLAAIFFFLCVWTWTRLKGAIAPPPLQTHQASFLQVIWGPCCMESNRALRRRRPVWQAPKTSSLLKTLPSNVVFALGIFHILSSWNIYCSWLDFIFVWLEIMQALSLKLIYLAAPSFINVPN